MGYTSYFNYNPNAIEDTEKLRKMFSKASKQIKRFANWLKDGSYGIEICGGLGEGKPIFNESQIWFNGTQKEGLDHETFNIIWSGGGKDFCKTARKPYDILVCFTLLTFAEIFPIEAFSFSSDGTMADEEWQKAKYYYETFTGKTAKIPQSMM